MRFIMHFIMPHMRFLVPHKECHERLIYISTVHVTPSDHHHSAVMVELKAEKTDKDVFEDQVKNEAQVAVNGPRSFFRRLIRVVLVISSVCYVVLLHLHRNATPKALHPTEHGHHMFGRRAEKAFL